MKRVALVVVASLSAACGQRAATGNASQGDQLEGCADAGDPPATLECTGLYADIGAKQVSAHAQPYAPATPLWADGADKSRWIAIPDGTTIDRSNPTEWSFPVGTKAWKEFSVGGKRIETRYFEKKTPTYWAYATYVWNDDASAAAQSFGETLPVAGAPMSSYVVPTPDECDKCHRGRTDRLLGFEEVSLGLPGATGLTLAQLAASALLSPPPPRTTLAIGDDGTGAAAPALGWLHVNCGTTCHNTNQNATGYGAGMNLRLDPTLLDGRSCAGFASLKTTVGVAAASPSYGGADRIVPGDPQGSLLVQLVSERGPTDQMPPIASRVVDQADVALLQTWIQRMRHASTPDAGAGDASADARVDAADAREDSAETADSGHDSGTVDSATAEADTADGGTVPDGQVDLDAPSPDAAGDAVTD